MRQEDLPEPMVGVLKARTFYVNDSRLYPLTNRTYKMKVRQIAQKAQQSWFNGNAEALCDSFFHTEPTKDCTCGIYSFSTVQEVAKQYFMHACNIVGVVAPAGIGWIGSRGIRSQSAKVKALWVDYDRIWKYNQNLTENYPDVRVFFDLQEMLEVYKDVDDGTGFQGYFDAIPTWIYGHEITKQSYIA